jgi:transposase
MYIDVLRSLRDAVRKKRHEKWRINSWFLLHHNAPAHRSVLVKDFLANSNVTTLERPPYSRDLPSAEFYLFPWLKSTLKGRRFCDATVIIMNAKEELKSFHKMASTNVSITCTATVRSGLPWRICGWNDLLFCISEMLSDSGNILKLPCVTEYWNREW